MNYRQRLEGLMKSNDLKNDIEAATDTLGNGITALYEGEQFRIDHLSCPAGADTKRRLYITKKGSTYLGHCFNCGKSGWLFEKAEKCVLGLDEMLALADVPPVVVKDSKAVSVAFNASSGTYSTVPTEIKVWLSLYGFGEEDFTALGLNWSGNILKFPIYNKEGTLVGYVSRIFGSYSYSNRYKAIVDQTVGKVPWIKVGSPDTLVVTEDILSAYKVWKATGFTTIALLGTSINDKANAFIAEFLPNNPKHVVVWLDKDFAGMANASGVGYTLSTMLGTSKFSIVEQQEEPKKQSEEDIRKILGEYLSV